MSVTAMPVSKGLFDPLATPAHRASAIAAKAQAETNLAGIFLLGELDEAAFVGEDEYSNQQAADQYERECDPHPSGPINGCDQCRLGGTLIYCSTLGRSSSRLFGIRLSLLI